MKSIRLLSGSASLLVIALLVAGCAPAPEMQEDAQKGEEKPVPTVEFAREPNQLQISVGGEPFGSYVYFDEEIPRPYFANVLSPSGVPVTRHHPPIPGQDEMDHATFHPGIWMAFGDLSGYDYWRLKARVEHEMFVEEPSGEPGKGCFAVRNYYLGKDESDRVAAEVARYCIYVTPHGNLLLMDSTYTPVGEKIVFGDQEEMGLGIRVHTPISVDYGGRMLDSEGRLNGDEIWGTQSDWVDYAGTVDGQWVGVTLMQHPGNFRKSWFHARDYGLIVANPFGRAAMKAGPESKLEVKAGEELRLRYGILIHSSKTEEDTDLPAAYETYLELAGAASEKPGKAAGEGD